MLLSPSSSCFLPLSLENHLPVRDVGIKAVNLHHGEARATVIEGRPPPTDRRFHNFITPVGPLVENIKSTYLNKITTVVHGPVVSKAIPRSTVKVTVPQEAFVDLDAWLSGGAGGGGGGCFVGGLGLQPCPADARLYVALTYEEAGPRFTFFQSSRGHCQIMNILRIYYSPSIMHRYAVVQPLHIEELTFGAVACLGTFSATDGWRGCRPERLSWGAVRRPARPGPPPDGRGRSCAWKRRPPGVGSRRGGGGPLPGKRGRS